MTDAGKMKHEQGTDPKPQGWRPSIGDIESRAPCNRCKTLWTHLPRHLTKQICESQGTALSAAQVRRAWGISDTAGTHRVALDMLLQVKQQLQVKIWLPLEVAAHFALFLVDVGEGEHAPTDE